MSNEENKEESISIAQNITNNAIKVNKASTTRVKEIENIESLVNTFINYSNEIQTTSKESLNSAMQTEDESQALIKLVEELFLVINNMSSALNDFSTIFDSLNKKNDSITELVQVNDKISMQTNLLAINAAIEASKAKEFGKGFSIVASEVKKLAQASKQSTINIGREIEDISKMTEDVSNKNEQVQNLVTSSVNISKEAVEKLKNVIVLSKQSNNDANNISSCVNSQLQSSDTIKVKIHTLVDDTKKAIDGSQTNINLGNLLLDKLKN